MGIFGKTRSTAEAIVNSTITDTIQFMLSDAQSCNQSNNQVLSGTQWCVNCDVCIQDINNISFDAQSYLNQDCVADFKLSADADEQIKQNFQQAAEAITKGLNIGSSTTDAKTIVNLMNDLAISITLSAKQSVNNVTNAILALGQHASLCHLAVQTLHDISFTTFTQQVQHSVMTSDMTAHIKQQLEEVIKQTATAKTIGLNFNLLAIIAAVIIAVIFAGKDTVKGLITTMPGMVITLTVIYLIIASIEGFIPFKRGGGKRSGEDSKLPCDKDGDCGHEGDSFTCISGNCEPKVACDEDGDCGSGDECISGNCEPKLPCDEDGDCGSGEECISGHCKPSSSEHVNILWAEGKWSTQSII